MQERYCSEIRLPACAFNTRKLRQLRQAIDDYLPLVPVEPLADPLLSLSEMTSDSTPDEIQRARSRAKNAEIQARQENLQAAQLWITYLLRHNDTRATEIWTTQSDQIPGGQIIGLHIDAPSLSTGKTIQVTLGDWSDSTGPSHIPCTAWNRLYVCSESRSWALSTSREIGRELEPAYRRWYGRLTSRWMPVVVFVVAMASQLDRSQAWRIETPIRTWLINFTLSVLVAAVSYILFQRLFPLFEFSDDGQRSPSQLARSVIAFAAIAVLSTGISWLTQLLFVW